MILRRKKKKWILILVGIIGINSCKSTIADEKHQKEKVNQPEYLLRFMDDKTHQEGYKDDKGGIVIESTKYDMCFTDTFRNFAIVAKPRDGFVAIDRNEKTLYQVFNFDNAPDEPINGLFRIVKNKKIGYANINTGEIVIDAKFDCAMPFENGVAKVSENCIMESDGEHTMWESKDWYYIDLSGKKTNYSEK